jgi:hypothetical protein
MSGVMVVIAVPISVVLLLRWLEDKLVDKANRMRSRWAIALFLAVGAVWLLGAYAHPLGTHGVPQINREITCQQYETCGR